VSLRSGAVRIAKESYLDQRLCAAVEQATEDHLLGCVRLRAHRRNVRIARTFVRFRLEAEQLTEATCDAAEWIVSELVTNVVVHHDWDLEPAVLVGISRTAQYLHLEVHDTDPAIPKMAPAAIDAEHGRGLWVVQGLSDSWGVGRTDEGKFVWARLVAWPDETSGSLGWCDGARLDQIARAAPVSARGTAWGAYKTIEDALRRRIAGGEFPAGSVLPSEAVLTAEYGVARNTLRRALSGLKEDGLLTTVPGRGWIVSTPGENSSEAADPHLQYRRIAAEVRARIDSGELSVGDRVPSGAELVEQYGVSR
jgi:DNA-binding transcriptional regulator YhcF (GntR family)/anti-sigma regulatory factor (Ser/Thr protein kinase)